MKWIAALWCLLICGFVQAQDNFPDVPDETSLDLTFHSRLKKYGFLIDGEFGGLGRPANHDFARATIATIQGLPTSLARYMKDGRSRAGTKTDKKHLIEEFNFIYLGVESGLIRWVRRFEKEIAALGHDSKSLLRVIERQWPDLERAAVYLWDEKTIPLKELVMPDRHPALRKFAMWRAEGLFVPQRPHWHTPAYRIDLARHVVTMVDSIPSFIQGVSDYLPKSTADPMYRDDRDTLEFVTELRNDVLSLIKEFSDEFSYFGETSQSLRARLAATQPQEDRLVAMSDKLIGRRFSDVPQGHWASLALEKLRRLGLLKGYPDGRFRG